MGNTGWAQVGKEFPNMRQDERRTVYGSGGQGVEWLPAQQAGFLFTNSEQGFLIHFDTLGVRSGIQILRVICCLDEEGILVRGVGGRVRQIPSPYMRKEGRQVILVRRT